MSEHDDEPADATPVQLTFLAEGRIARVALAAGKGNVLDRAVVAALSEAFRSLGADHAVRAVVLTTHERDFSFGASVPEHAPGEVETMLPAFHGLFRAMHEAALPICAAVRGRCLGGGFELAIAAHHLVVAKDARLGLPEVTLGVFPPVAAAVLPLRARQPIVDRLIVAGETIDGATAAAWGVADEVTYAALVEERAIAHAARFASLSGTAIRFATRAARAAWGEALSARLAYLERLYLDELMRTDDAREGIAAFLERRAPVWRDR